MEFQTAIPLFLVESMQIKQSAISLQNMYRKLLRQAEISFELALMKWGYLQSDAEDFTYVRWPS